jgi:hypothetical protein
MTGDLRAPEQASGGSLLRATLIAVGVAAVLLLTCVLPAEYGIDPTGIGRVLGLTQMGEVKMALAEEAASNAAAEASADSVIAASENGAEPVKADSVGAPAAAVPGGDSTASVTPATAPR